MPRSAEGVYKRGAVWWLDCRIDGKRYQVKLGRNISKTTAREIALTQRTRILKGEVGIARKKRDIRFDDAVELFMDSDELRSEPLRSNTTKTASHVLGNSSAASG